MSEEQYGIREQNKLWKLLGILLATISIIYVTDDSIRLVLMMVAIFMIWVGVSGDRYQQEQDRTVI